MESIRNYFNEKETSLINSIKQDISRIKQKHYMLSNTNDLKHKKYLNNLLRQIDSLKDDLYNLQAERITEVMFYEKTFINEKNIDTLNKDVLQIVNDFNFNGIYYLFYKQTDEDFYHISNDIDTITTLLKEGWIEKIYKGEYNKELTIDDLKDCELVFNKKTMKFKKINTLNIRKTKEIYELTITTNKNNKEDSKNYIIRDINDYYNVEDYITENNLDLKSINLCSIEEINDEFIQTLFEMSIQKAELYNKVNIKRIEIGDTMINTLHTKINTFMNKDKLNPFDEDIELL